jgi:hypothetical protein
MVPGMPNVCQQNGFWFVNDHLIIPNQTKVHKALFQLACDNLGHFGVPKTYATLHESFYWPGMKHNLKDSYIPSCADCQQNKACTTQPTGPLHPSERLLMFKAI